MRSSKIVFLFLSLFVSVFIIGTVFAQQPPASQTSGGQLQQQLQVEKKQRLEKKIEAPMTQEAPSIKEEVPEQQKGPTVMVNTIQVEGVTLIPAETIESIIAPYKNRKLSLAGMQKIADMITDEYRKKGYVTSRAYIPPQTMKNGILIIRVIEGRLGKIDIQGNKYFKSSVLEKKIDLQPAGYFDYSALQRSLVYINEHPDRTARAVLVPGKEPGTTDIMVEVKDRNPLHFGFEFDNYGSRYIDYYRYSLVGEHNNLTGNDDKLYMKLQYAEGYRLKLQQIRYRYPVNRTLEVGGYYLRSSIKLGREFKDLGSRGKAYIYGLFINKVLKNTEDLDVRLNFGFDYKSAKNYLLDAETSKDDTRVFKTGIDVDYMDKWGRTIFTSELDVGVPHLMGGMPAKDDHASRAGAGGQFTKGVFNMFRLQPMPWETTLLWKNSAQWSNNNLVASEQFQIGGPISVRGYPPAEHYGDTGYYTSFEWSAPLYFLNKGTTVPYTKGEVRWYDALRFVVFFDWATAQLNSPSGSEQKKETLRGWGYGMRLNIRDNLTCRIEAGYPLGGQDPSDGKHVHPWVEFTAKF